MSPSCTDMSTTEEYAQQRTMGAYTTSIPYNTATVFQAN